MGIITKTLIYSDGPMTFQGFIAWKDDLPQRKPLILIAHAFRGQGAFDEEKALVLAELGYVGFAIDMYGQGRRAKDADEAGRLMNELTSDRPLLLKRILLALKTGRELPQADPERVGAIGFCFGGKCVLDLARSGATLRGVVSFHGLYDPPGIHHPGPIRASVLVLHGWEDPLAPPQAVLDLSEELTARQAEWTIHMYGHTGHAFTNPQAQNRESGLFYQEKSSQRAWLAMQNFFAEVML